MGILAWFLFGGNTTHIETFGLMSAFLAFMALGVKFLQSPEFLCQKVPHKAKNYKISIYVHKAKKL